MRIKSVYLGAAALGMVLSVGAAFGETIECPTGAPTGAKCSMRRPAAPAGLGSVSAQCAFIGGLVYANPEWADAGKLAGKRPAWLRVTGAQCEEREAHAEAKRAAKRRAKGGAK